ncbi:hypothetical protein L1987_46881 [Smallanthus sonchifolius]|uniref:Uncharacterized protein n=1 Tax=Smallanthus sonchifolius TaxID=185202 RepID=A0ACB9G2S0_9ASTR|nr:hypothetical protein L1987_46881 [Smallanthus sonchifolius]
MGSLLDDSKRQMGGWLGLQFRFIKFLHGALYKEFRNHLCLQRIHLRSGIPLCHEKFPVCLASLLMRRPRRRMRRRRATEDAASEANDAASATEDAASAMEDAA